MEPPKDYLNDRDYQGKKNASNEDNNQNATFGTDSTNTKDIVAQIIAGEPEIDEEVDPEFLNDFLVETGEHIENIEMNLLALETDPENLEIIHSLFRSFHTIKGLAGFVNQDLIRNIAHQTETQLDKCRKGELKVSKGFIDLVLASSDLIKQISGDLSLTKDPVFLNSVTTYLDNLKKGPALPDTGQEQSLPNKATDRPEVDKIGAILVDQGLNPNTLDELLTKQAEFPELKLGQVAVKEKKANPKEVIESLRIQEKQSKNGTNESGYGYTRVPTSKIDNLVDLIGELVINQSQIEQEVTKRFGANDPLVNKLLRLEKSTKDIQNISMSLRMVSLKSTFQKINRIGRDTINELGKQVNLELEGEETEIDRSIAERLLDPLVHLVKNAISHGIEDQSARLAKGKPAQGQVKIEAYSKRGNVYIEVTDDGQGMNVEKIYQKAIDKQLLDPGKTYSDEEITKVIFLPGFSTAEKLNNVSGRGVGLDVVKTEVSKIGGRVELANYPGEGCKFTLKIPINLAAINGTIVDINGDRYIIPTLYIKQIVKLESSQWVSIAGNNTVVRIRDDVIPVLPITKIFGIPGEAPEQAELMIILELEQVLRALPVRNIVDRREIVVKPLGSDFSHLEYVSGASILGDGKVSLILDVDNLFKLGEAV